MKQIIFLFALLNCFVGYSQKRSVAPVYTTTTQILSNKSIDADANTVTNISNSAIKASAGIAVDKLAAVTANRVIVSDASGFYSPSSVTTTTLGYLDPTSSIQSQLDNKASNALTSAHVFVGNGLNVATGVAFSGDATITNTGDVQLASGAIVNTDINASAAIDATKLIDGSISNTELGYINTLNANAQTQFTNRVKKGGDTDGTDLTIGTLDANNLIFTTNSNGLWKINSSGYLSRNLTTSNFGLQLGNTGVGAVMTFGDVFDASTPYISTREHGGTDTDQWEAFGQKGIYFVTNTYGGTARMVIQQDGDIIIGGETQVAGAELTVIGDGDVSGNLNIQGDLTASNIYKGSASLDFPSTVAGAVSDLTITATGAALGDPVSLGVPNGSVTTTATYWAWVSSANTVTVRFSPKATENPASGTFKVKVFKY